MARVLALCVLLLGLPATVAAQESRDGESAYYVLALSWSPGYCASAKPGRSPFQCDSGMPFAFVLHGLWPQGETGRLAHCSTGEAGPSASLVRAMLDIMPSEGLIRHQWRKHGSCSGLSAEDFFALSRAAYEATRVPEAYQAPDQEFRASAAEVETAFLEANPGLREDSVSVVCRDGSLREVRLCLSLDLGYRSCPEIERNACRQKGLSVLPVAR